MKKMFILTVCFLFPLCVNAQWKVGRVTKTIDYYHFDAMKRGARVAYSENKDGTITVYEHGYEGGYLGVSKVANVVEFTGLFIAEVTDPVDDYVNFRKGPGTNYPVVGKLYVGRECLFQKTAGNWIKVYLEETDKRDDGYFMGYDCELEEEPKFIGYIYYNRVTTPEVPNGIYDVVKRKDAIVWREPLCPDDNHPHAIDLGIGDKWACCNVGASAPAEAGEYYVWGETETKSHYDETNYKFEEKIGGECRAIDIGRDISCTSYDVAYVKSNGKWCMPCSNKIEKLLNNCKYQWAVVDGIKGGLFTGPNGNRIFMPAAGYFMYDRIEYKGVIGEYCSSSIDEPHPSWQNVPKYGFDSNEVDHTLYASLRSDFGFTVRPILNE